MVNRTLAAALLTAALGGGMLWRVSRTAAADADKTAWGAIDPAWSPDSRRLAFSLFGSIWTVAAEGGEARQATTGPGYHAHPAWSPKGDSIVFVNGAVPAGVLPYVRGQLMIANAETGETKHLPSAFPTAGTPSWSADGSKVVVPLAAETGALLYELDVAGGPSRALQQNPQRGRTGAWMTTSWAHKSNEIYFAGIRSNAVTNGVQLLGAPQVWTMPGAHTPVMVQMPLTGYRLTDIAQIDGVSALPDGSGAIYSAVVVNGKGDRELYRVNASGGAKPVAVTNTPRDEFMPAVSPDGKLIAHVSNHLGNLDLFTMPVAGGEKKHVAITKLKFRAASGRIRVKTLDERGEPSPVRLFVKASDEKAYAPRGEQIFYYGLEPAGARDGFFLTKGDDEFEAPAGRIRLTALKGVEYRMEETTVDIPAGGVREVTIHMRRWTNWNQKGWYTGENHFHANYNGSYYQRPPESMQWLEAEDLNTANMIVANSEGAFIHDKEFFTGGPAANAKPRFVLYWGQEYRNSEPLGHMAFLNVKKQVPPSFTSVVGSNSSIDYPLNTMAAQEARKQGGLVVYVHPIAGTLQDVFDTNLGAKEAPLTAALGAMDGMDILPFGPPAYELWYRLLNVGFRISPGAGTDVFTNWRGINRIPGLSRQYVDTGTEFTWAKWVERFREGRVFVTNGPLVAFDVNGQAMGSVIQAAAGQVYRAKISAEVTSLMPLDVVEIVSNGAAIESRRVPQGANSFRLEREVEVKQSTWFAVRVAGRPARGLPNELPRAHSAPVFVQVGGAPVLVKDDVQLMIRWLERLWASLEERNNYGPGQNRARARAMFEAGLKHYRDKLARL